MIHMGLLNIIRRMSLREKLSIREIARRTGLSRNTITKYLNAGTIEPQFMTPERHSKLDPFAEKLAGWLKTEGAKSRKQRRTLKQMHADLVVLGFDGSYGRVAAFARDWRADRQRDQQTTGRGTFVPLLFRPGEAFQFDWSEDLAGLGGERTKLQAAHIKLSHSRAYLLQTHGMLFDAHWHGFRVFGGIPERGIYDNMRTAVHRVGRGKERQVNMRFLAMANHYVFEPVFCNPAAGWEKGQVEKNVQDSRHRLWQPMPDFPDLAALNDWLEQQCVALWGDIPHAALPGSVADVWAAERTALLPLPPAFDGVANLPDQLRTQPLQRSGVLCQPPGEPAGLSERLVIAAEGQILCEHVRVIERSHQLPPRTIGSSNPCGSDDRRLGKGHERPPHSSAVCPSRGRLAHPIASSTSSGNAWRRGHFCGFASGSPVRLRLRRPLAKANVFALELKSRPRLGAICRQEPSDRDGS